MAQTRGSTLNGLYDYLNKVAPARVDELLAGVPAELRAELGHCKHAGWYPAEYFSALNEAVARVSDDPAKRVANLQGAGEHVATIAINSFMRLVLRMLTPSMFATKFPTFWRRDNTFGDVSISAVSADDGIVHVNMMGVSCVTHIVPVGSGYVKTILTHLLNRDVHPSFTEYTAENPAPDNAVLHLRWDV